MYQMSRHCKLINCRWSMLVVCIQYRSILNFILQTMFLKKLQGKKFWYLHLRRIITINFILSQALEKIPNSRTTYHVKIPQHAKQLFNIRNLCLIPPIFKMQIDNLSLGISTQTLYNRQIVSITREKDCQHQITSIQSFSTIPPTLSRSSVSYMSRN